MAADGDGVSTSVADIRERDRIAKLVCSDDIARPRDDWATGNGGNRDGGSGGDWASILRAGNGHWNSTS